jgi:hypothetical protein
LARAEELPALPGARCSKNGLGFIFVFHTEAARDNSVNFA